MRQPVEFEAIERAVSAVLDTHKFTAPMTYEQLVDGLLEDPSVAAVVPNDTPPAHQLIRDVLDQGYFNDRWPAMTMRATVTKLDGWYNPPISNDRAVMPQVTLTVLVEKLVQKFERDLALQTDCHELYSQLMNPLISLTFQESVDDMKPRILQALQTLRDYGVIEFVRVYYPAGWQGDPVIE